MMEYDDKHTPRREYEKPEIKDYGNLRELTAGSTVGSVTDVPLNSPAAPDIFTNP